jgi:hypothetical protein
MVRRRLIVQGRLPPEGSPKNKGHHFAPGALVEGPSARFMALTGSSGPGCEAVRGGSNYRAKNFSSSVLHSGLFVMLIRARSIGLLIGLLAGRAIAV